MSQNNSYYSASENDEKFKKPKLILCIVFAVLVLVTCVYTIVYSVNLEKANAPKSEIVQSENFFINVLLCVSDKDNEYLDPQFMLIGIDGDDKTITLGEIPAEQTIDGEDKTGTVRELFSYGGAKYLKEALVNHYGISIEKYIACSLSEVETFVDKLGGVDYNIKQQMQYKNKDGNLITNLVQGKQKLNGNQFCQYIRFNKWKNNGEKRKMREELLAALLNEHMSSLDSETILDLYKSVSNKLDTDASIIEVNDFSLQFGVFLEESSPAVSAEINYSDSDVSKAKIKSLYQ